MYRIYKFEDPARFLWSLIIQDIWKIAFVHIFESENNLFLNFISIHQNIFECLREVQAVCQVFQRQSANSTHLYNTAIVVPLQHHRTAWKLLYKARLFSEFSVVNPLVCATISSITHETMTIRWLPLIKGILSSSCWIAGLILSEVLSMMVTSVLAADERME